MFLAAHLGSLNAAATSGPFTSIHNLIAFNGVGGAHDKELVPIASACTPILFLCLPKKQVWMCARVCVYVCYTTANLATNRSIHVQSIIQRVRVVARKRVLTKIYRHSRRPRLTRSFHIIVIDNDVLTRFSRRLFREKVDTRPVSNRLTKEWWSVSLRVNAFLDQIDVPWSWCPAKMPINRKDQIAL